MCVSPTQCPTDLARLVAVQKQLHFLLIEDAALNGTPQLTQRSAVLYTCHTSVLGNKNVLATTITKDRLLVWLSTMCGCVSTDYAGQQLERLQIYLFIY